MAVPAQHQWVLVAGTGTYALREQELWSSECIGRALARNGYGLVVGGWPGVDHIAARSFTETLAEIAPGTRLADRLIQVVPSGKQPDFAGGHLIYVEPGPLEWLEALRFAKAAILIGGIGGTFDTYVFATQERVPVFPLAGTGSDAALVFQEILNKWREIGPWGVRHTAFVTTLGRQIEKRQDAHDQSNMLIRLLEDHFAFSDALNRGIRKSVFFSYSHKDRGWLQEVRQHFGVVPGQEVTLWDDTMIKPGQDWDNEILSRLIRSRVAILIITPQFTGSKYIRNHELPFLVTQHKAGNLRIFWLMAEKTDLTGVDLLGVQAAHDPAQPLNVLPPSKCNAVLANVSTQIVNFLRDPDSF
ncbi:toll/interleukin-1 receptor domain-containing protein [Methylobacterium frigidaeris]|uniref:TIR domain-containing protein n=1 Tax=Methylobacterium frigidaeris TaxID=2038277 RepID=A0AA37HJ47_9HYPH|nr:toll/interleukin-1 receptor domain-containing protein [Methylobacterium frigidaeris]GJD66811.1 hypothetical protein MPEAHAMD_7010 [Methylobacterium frigidaeris]